jgi:hypothetical protein
MTARPRDAAPRSNTVRHQHFTGSRALIAFALAASAGVASFAQAEDAAGAPKPGSLAYDKSVWHALLADHALLRRVVRHTPAGVEALTESDDPRVAALIIDHAKAMQGRMKRGSLVRGWDPVFVALFEKHEAVHIEVTPTDRGVKIVEHASDEQAMRLMRSHATGVSEFVRRGFDAAHQETALLGASDPMPLDEMAIGSVPHRLVLSAPDASQESVLRRAGLRVVHVGGATDAPATSATIDAALASLRQGLQEADITGAPLAIVLADDASRVAWGVYRVADQGVAREQALREVEAAGLHAPASLEAARALIASQSAPGATPR